MELIQVRTADGVRLVGTHVTAGRRGDDDRAKAGDDGRAKAGDDDRAKDLAIVLAHGFTVSVERPHLRRVALRFARHAGVVMFDFRGHGRSDGRTTAGDLEVLDLDAAVRWARDAGYRRLATVGFSMGGAVALRHAAASPTSTGLPAREPVDAVVAVSPPSRWFIRETVPMRRVHWLLETPSGHWLAAKALRTRIGGVWGVPPEWPAVVVGRIAPTPLLLVQGDRDRYFGVEHGRALATAAGPAAEYWELAGFGHAEGAMTPALVDRIGGWVATSAGRAGTMRR